MIEVQADALTHELREGQFTITCRGNTDGSRLQFLEVEAIGEVGAGVVVNQGEDSAFSTGTRDTEEARGGLVGEGVGEVGADKKMVFFGDVSGLLVVFNDGFEVLAKIHLDDFLHVLGEFGKPLVDLLGLRPDSIVDDAFFVVSKMHEGRKVLAEANWVDDSEVDFSWRQSGKEPEDEIVEAGDGDFVIAAAGLDEKGSFLRERQVERCGEAFSILDLRHLQSA